MPAVIDVMEWRIMLLPGKMALQYGINRYSIIVSFTIVFGSG